MIPIVEMLHKLVIAPTTFYEERLGSSDSSKRWMRGQLRDSRAGGGEKLLNKRSRKATDGVGKQRKGKTAKAEEKGVSVAQGAAERPKKSGTQPIKLKKGKG